MVDILVSLVEPYSEIISIMRQLGVLELQYHDTPETQRSRRAVQERQQAQISGDHFLFNKDSILSREAIGFLAAVSITTFTFKMRLICAEGV